MLTSSQSHLVQALLSGGRRWAIVSPPTGLRLRTVEVAAAWLNTRVSVPDGGSGAVISPPSVMHAWWHAGWKGAHATPQQLLRGVEPLAASYTRKVSFVIDELLDYNEAVLTRLDELLSVDADNCLFFLPPDPSAAFGDVIGRHNFRLLNLNPVA